MDLVKRFTSELAPAFAGHAPIEVFVIERAGVWRKGEIVARSKAECFETGRKPLENVRLSAEAIEHAAL